ncbi:MAG: site-2 protease family protein [Clostridiaceae bacterium]
MNRKGLMLGFELLILISLGIHFKFITVLIFVFLHEMSHGLAAILLGANMKKLFVHPLGFFVEIEDLEELTEKKQLAVYLSGPAINLLLSVIFYVYDGYVFSELSIINIMLFIFNMLPAYPLDGGRIFTMALSRRISYRLSGRIVVYFSIAAGSAFTGLFIYSIFKLHKLNINLLMIGILMLYSALKEKKRIMYILMGDLVRKRGRLTRNKYLSTKTVSVYSKLGLVNILTMVDKNKFNSFLVLNEDMKMIGVINEDELLEALKKHGNISLEEYFERRKLS